MLMEEIFDRAAALAEQGWCQGVSAINSGGAKTRWHQEDAACFCAFGAVARAMSDLGEWREDRGLGETVSIMQTVLREMGSSTVSITAWNDREERTKAEVVDFLHNCASHAANLEALDAEAKETA